MRSYLQITIPADELIDPYALYNNMTLKQLNDSYGPEVNFNFIKTFQKPVLMLLNIIKL